MSYYILVVNTSISLHTAVDAPSLSEAIEIAKRRAVMSLCHHCSNKDDEAEWVTSGELDGDPATSPLVDVVVDGESLGQSALECAMVRW